MIAGKLSKCIWAQASLSLGTAISAHCFVIVLLQVGKHAGGDVGQHGGGGVM
jgi:hypothetical protein